MKLLVFFLFVVASVSQTFVIQNFDVRTYGARGDGLTDDTAAIQAAIAAVQSAGVNGVIIFVCGQYKIGSTLTIPSNGVSLRGISQCAQLRYTPSSGALIDINPAGTGITSGNVIENLSLYKVGAAGSSEGIRANRQNTLTIRDNYITGFQKGINILGADTFQVRVTGNNINGVPTGGVAFLGSYAAELYYDSNVISCSGHTPPADPGIGIYFVDVTGSYVNNNDVMSCLNSWRVKPGSGQGVTWIHSNGNFFDSSASMGIIIEPEAGGTVAGIFSEQDWIASGGDSGLYVSKQSTGTVDGVHFSNLQTVNNVRHGIELFPDPINFSCTDCVASGNSAAFSGTCTTNGTAVTLVASGPYNGVFSNFMYGKTITINSVNYTVASVISGSSITLTSTAGVQSTPVAWSFNATPAYAGFSASGGASSFQISGGIFGPSQSFPDTQAYGMIVNTGASNHFSITGVNVRGNINGNIVNNATGQDGLIKDNLGYNPVGISSITVTASPFTYTAGATPVVVLVETTTATTSITRGGKVVCTTAPCSITLPPNGAIVATYNSTAPVLWADIQ